MKKSLLLLLIAVMTAQLASAQDVAKSKFRDNWYAGVYTGISVPAATFEFSDNTNYQTGIRIGRNFSPIFGIMAEAQLHYGSNGSHFNECKTINAYDANIIGTCNITNLLNDYLGSPRKFEATALIGFGPAHIYSNNPKISRNSNCGTSKLAVDLALNLGSDKQWQLYAEPSFLYMFYNKGEKTQYNINHALFTLNLGITYKFKNSNGTHNFVLE